VSENPYYATSALLGSGSNLWAIAVAQLEMIREARIDTEMKRHNVIGLTGSSPGSLMMVLNKKITGLKDIRRLRVRTPSASIAKLLEELGAVPVMLPGREVYDALDKGVVDAAVSGVSAVFQVNWHEVSKSLVLLGVEIAADAQYFINRDLWNKFSPAARAILDAGGMFHTDYLMRYQIESEAADLRRMQKEFGMQIYRPTSHEQAEINAAAAKSRQLWYREWDAKGYKTEKWFSDFQKVVKKYEQEFAQKGYPWNR
jgi:TRAP-type C4-dicarboxylate transport system substrate-binding protein